MGDSGIKAEAESEYLQQRGVMSIARIGSKLVRLAKSEHSPYINQLKLVTNMNIVFLK